MKQHCKPNRLAEYDYSQPGYYFITICTKNMLEYFGSIEKGELLPTATGLVVNWHWRHIPNHYQLVSLIEYQLMPNHLHGILAISKNYQPDPDLPRRKMLIPRVIGSFKKFATRQIRSEINPDFHWQRSFYDHVIRNKESLEKIREYIISNPDNWERAKHFIDDNPFYL